MKKGRGNEVRSDDGRRKTQWTDATENRTLFAIACTRSAIAHNQRSSLITSLYLQLAKPTATRRQQTLSASGTIVVPRPQIYSNLCSVSVALFPPLRRCPRQGQPEKKRWWTRKTSIAPQQPNEVASRSASRACATDSVTARMQSREHLSEPSAKARAQSRPPKILNALRKRRSSWAVGVCRLYRAEKVSSTEKTGSLPFSASIIKTWSARYMHTDHEFELITEWLCFQDGYLKSKTHNQHDA